MNLENRIRELEDEVDNLEDRIAELEDEIASLETVVDNQKHRLMLGLDADLTLAEFLDRLETT